MTREVVYYDEMHTMMYQVVTVHINEKILTFMLDEPLNDESKRELIQAYYVFRLDQDIEIKPKHNYGAWNASIADIKNMYVHEAAILEKLVGNVKKEDLEKNIKIINEHVLGLSEEETYQSFNVQKAFFTALGLQHHRPKI